MRKSFLVLSIAIVLVGCTPLERQAYETVVAANATIKTLRGQHPECASSSAGICGKLTQAVAAKDTLIDAAEIYCAGPSFNAGGACNPPEKGTPAATQATAKLQSAIASWNQIAADLRSTQ